MLFFKKFILKLLYKRNRVVFLLYNNFKLALIFVGFFNFNKIIDIYQKFYYYNIDSKNKIS